jgi:hypothetical protein
MADIQKLISHMAREWEFPDLAGRFAEDPLPDS